MQVGLVLLLLLLPLSRPAPLHAFKAVNSTCRYRRSLTQLASGMGVRSCLQQHRGQQLSNNKANDTHAWSRPTHHQNRRQCRAGQCQFIAQWRLRMYMKSMCNSL